MSDSGRSDQLVEHFFRHKSAELVAVLCRAFGFALIDVIEDMVQEALIAALRSWRIGGIPENPEGWLFRVARNKVIDSLRRQKKQSEIVDELRLEVRDGHTIVLNQDELNDSLLKMIFATCHPLLDRRSQLAITLKVVCGFSDEEVGRGLLVKKETAKKRVTRAKRRLQLNKVSLELPSEPMLEERLDAVHEVMYLMFNEGYSATAGSHPIRLDLCEEAARICHLLCTCSVGVPATSALMALMLFHAARMGARVGDNGLAVLLEDQDRSQWDRPMIKVAENWLQRTARGTSVSRYHLEAGIARLHCSADSVEVTDWSQIAKHYELLGNLYPSPIYDLNHAIAVGRQGDTDRAFTILAAVESEDCLQAYAPLHCARADLYHRSGRTREAAEELRRALTLPNPDHQQHLIEQLLRRLENPNH